MVNIGETYKKCVFSDNIGVKLFERISLNLNGIQYNGKIIKYS